MNGYDSSGPNWPDDMGGSPGGDLPRVEVGNGPETIRAVREAVGDGVLPAVYVTDGRLVHVEEVSGTASHDAGDENAPLPVTPSLVTPPKLAVLLADHTYTFRRKKGSGKASDQDDECTPPKDALTAVLASKTWPNLPPLRGVVGAPVLRSDGTLLQAPGYDKRTGLYLASRVGLDTVPDEPSEQEVREAHTFLLDKFLRDFPWVSNADRANYVGLLVTPILRRYVRALTPFGLVTATMPGSGKTILTMGLGMLYGQRVLTWTDSDEELRKTITSVLGDVAGTIIFDNLAEGTSVASPVLARLMTDPTWVDRRLGGNTTAVYANDRMWLATGNNLTLGGDMRSRSVLVSLDPNMPHPEQREHFTIPHLDQWMLDRDNQRRVLWNLLVLVVDWTRHGAPRAKGVPMRQFTTWPMPLADSSPTTTSRASSPTRTRSRTSTSQTPNGSPSSRVCVH